MSYAVEVCFASECVEFSFSGGEFDEGEGDAGLLVEVDVCFDGVGGGGLEDLLAVDVEFCLLEGGEEFEGLDLDGDEDVDVALLGDVSACDASVDYGGNVIFVEDFEEGAAFLS